MKRKILKALVLMTLVTALIFTFSVGAFAEEAEADFTPGEESEVENEADNTLYEIYESIKENSDKLLSLCSFIGTLLIAFIYKKGLLPGLKKVTASVTDALSAIKNEAEKTETATKDYGQRLDSLSAKTEEMVNDLKALENDLSPEKADKERRLLYTVMNGQMELLYDIFMSSSLPEYKKEEVGTRINKMKEVLKNEDEITV